MFIGFIKSRWKTIMAFLVFFIIFIAVFSLYSLPVTAVIYAFSLSAFFAVIFSVYDYRRCVKKHRFLQRSVMQSDTALCEMVPKDSIIESDYMELAQAISNDRKKLISENSACVDNMTEYYTMWAHQIKTPISAMRLMLQSNGNVDKKECSEELFKIEQYVEMVLGYLRLESVSTDYIIAEYSLDDIICEAVRKYASQFIRKKISLVYEPVNKKVLADEKWLLFVIEQILSNALKYTRQGSVSITCDSNNNLSVSDTGMGISPDDLPRIFENGFTGYNGRADKHSTGIGLYLCRRITEKMGYNISAKSVVGEGTIITLHLKKYDTKFE